ncbi:MAG TPA: TolC family protein, partial [Casimicrobiaceae bacterium]|nr:TolC family protein [Casimicrobiaceae bacterium]
MTTALDTLPKWCLRMIACVALLLSVAACSFAPEFARPALPVASEYPADAPRPSAGQADSRTAADTSWRDYFADEGLQRVIAQALENNRDLRLAALRVLETRAIYQIHRADEFPTIGAGSDMFRLGVPKDFSTTGSYHAIGFYDVGLTAATWEIDFWGRVRNLKDAALEQFLASDSARRAVTVSLIAQVANT